MRVSTLILASGLLWLSSGTPSVADDDGLPGEYSIGGWIRADYGSGDRYPEEDGEDRLGVSQAALLGKWMHKNVEGILLLGGTNLTADDTDGDGDIGIKDAFIIWKEIGGSDFRLSAGVQPLFFGLKSNGFPGDRSLQPSLEFGGGGGFAVSQQAGPSVLLHYDATESLTITGGVFDTSSSTAEYFRNTGLGRIDGSSIDSNYILQVKLDPHRGDHGFYLFAGIAGRYIGDEIDSTKSILDFGFGYKHRRFDISIEAIQLDEAFLRTADDEIYAIAELTVFATERLRFYFDYAMADETEIETLRAGFKFDILPKLTFIGEFSDDDFGPGFDSVSSGDIRLEFSF